MKSSSNNNNNNGNLSTPINPYLPFLLAPLLHLQRYSLCSVPCLSGVEKVPLGVPCAAAVTLCGLRPPEYFWYSISGGLCDIVQLAVDAALTYRCVCACGARMRVACVCACVCV